MSQQAQIDMKTLMVDLAYASNICSVLSHLLLRMFLRLQASQPRSLTILHARIRLGLDHYIHGDRVFEQSPSLDRVRSLHQYLKKSAADDHLTPYPGDGMPERLLLPR